MGKVPYYMKFSRHFNFANFAIFLFNREIKVTRLKNAFHLVNFKIKENQGNIMISSLLYIRI